MKTKIEEWLDKMDSPQRVDEDFDLRNGAREEMTPHSKSQMKRIAIMNQEACPICGQGIPPDYLASFVEHRTAVTKREVDAAVEREREDILRIIEALEKSESPNWDWASAKESTLTELVHAIKARGEREATHKYRNSRIMPSGV